MKMEWKTSVYLANLLDSCIRNKSLLLGKALHAYILRSALLSDVFLSNRLIELYSKCNHPDSAFHVFDQMPHKDVYSWNAILTCHCKVGNLRSARKVFDEMPERNVVSWNNLISALVRSGFEHKALDMYEVMISAGILPSHVTFASVLSACGLVLDANIGRRCQGLAIKIGLDKNMFVCNGLLCMYAKCGLTREAIQAFSDLEQPNEVSFTALIGGFTQADRAVEAFDLFRLMRRKGIQVDSVALASILGVSSRGRQNEYDPYSRSDMILSTVNGHQVHAFAVKLGFMFDIHLANTLLDMYSKSGDIESTEKVFADLPETNTVSWNVMIAAYGQKCCSDKSMQYLHRMYDSGLEPDEITYINMLAACVKSGDVGTARKIFESMTSPSVSSWNAMLSCYSQNGNHVEVTKLFRTMQFQCITPDRTTLAIVLSSCSEMQLQQAGQQVHATSIKAEVHSDVYVASGLIGTYSKCRRAELAERVFQYMPELDIVCWNAMIAGFSLNSLEKKSLSFFQEMRQIGMVPTEFSYATVISCCAQISSLFVGRQVHSLVAKDGYLVDTFVGSTLINMYSRCGHVDEARRFFDAMHFNNIVTWNEMIHGYAQNGHGLAAVHLFQQMIASNQKPDEITFVAVLTGCSHSGLADEALEIFNAIKSDEELEPELDHYTCLIDTLGRAGRFEEAEALIDEIPYKDDPIVWEVVLSCCRVHANVTLARRAAEELFRLDPRNSTPYVLLANIYASLGRWDDVRDVRMLMNEKEINKGPGYSRTEYGFENFG